MTALEPKHESPPSTTAPAEIPVPRELLPALRENVKRALLGLGDGDPWGEAIDEEVDQLCADAEVTAAAYRAFKADADAYPADAVRFAATQTIEDATSRITDDRLPVDEAEFWVKRVRACEKLREMAA